MNLFKSLIAAVLASTAFMSTAFAATVDIYACYACQNTGNAAVDAALTANPSVASDGLLFAFVNTGSSAITNAIFSVSNATPNDSFLLGTIGAGATVIMLPGLSNDLGVHAPGGLFADIGSTMDTSDGNGGVTDSSTFLFTGMAGSSALSSGNISAGESSLIMTWRDAGATGQTSFLGLGPNGDGGCTNCYFGKIGSASSQVVGAVPEPETYALLLAGLGAIAFAIRRRPSESEAGKSRC